MTAVRRYGAEAARATARRTERGDLPARYRSEFNRALLVFGEKGYAIR